MWCVMLVCSCCGEEFIRHEFECMTFCRGCRVKACKDFSIEGCEPRRSGQGVI